MTIKQRTIYLAGPMEHVSAQDAKGWRSTVTAIFQEYNRNYGSTIINVLDPTRRVHNFEKRYMKRIFELDLRDIQESDIILVNLDRPEIPKHGTAMEVFYASHTLRKPVVAFKSDASTIHPFFESLVTEWRSNAEKAADTIITEYLV